MTDVYYIDGQFVAADQAVLPLNDLGILRGYGIFDFMRTYAGRPIFIRDHIRRLFRSADRLGLTLPWPEEELAGLVGETLRRNRHDESGIRILVTGGPSADFITPSGNPRLAIMVTALKTLPAATYSTGAAVITVPHNRFLPGAKSTDYTRAILALAEARRAGAIEAIYSEDGWVYEGTTSNIFAVIRRKLVTPGEGILEGITREKTLRLAEGLLPIDIRRLGLSELLGASEVFITSSSRGIVPIVRVDGETIGGGSPGPGTRELMKAFAAYAEKLAAAAEPAGT
jgi:branched-chain amino acid aminotransferase